MRGLFEGGLQEVESDLVDGLRGRASRSCYVWNIHLVMLDQLPQKEWGLREVFRRNEEVRFFSLASVFQGEERSTCNLRMVGEN